MSWRYQNRKRSDKDEDERENHIEDPFSRGFRSTNLDIDQIIDSMLRTAESFNSNSNSNGVFYGYQVNVGPDGKPQVREFGNIKPKAPGAFEHGPREPSVDGPREPFVDVVVNEKERSLKVVAEMPGVQKEDIELHAVEDSLTIKAENKDRDYNTTVPLKDQVEPGSSRASYRNGILEVVLKLKEDPKSKGLKIKVD